MSQKLTNDILAIIMASIFGLGIVTAFVIIVGVLERAIPTDSKIPELERELLQKEFETLGSSLDLAINKIELPSVEIITSPAINLKKSPRKRFFPSCNKEQEIKQNLPIFGCSWNPITIYEERLNELNRYSDSPQTRSLFYNKNLIEAYLLAYGYTVNYINANDLRGLSTEQKETVRTCIAGRILKEVAKSSANESFSQEPIQLDIERFLTLGLEKTVNNKQQLINHQRAFITGWEKEDNCL